MSGTSEGNGCVVFGVVVGIIILLVCCHKSNEMKKTDGSRNNLKTLGLNLNQYVMDHNDLFPQHVGAKGLNELVNKNYIESSNTGLLIAPSDKHRKKTDSEITEKNTSYCFIGLIDYAQCGAAMMIAWEKPDIWRENGNKKMGFALFLDGHTEQLNDIERALREEVERWRENGYLKLLEEYDYQWRGEISQIKHEIDAIQSQRSIFQKITMKKGEGFHATKELLDMATKEYDEFRQVYGWILDSI